jgi:DNA-binding PadR family transcriptional regulator
VREYRLTPLGRTQLAAERSRWEQLTAVMTQLLANPQEGTS